ncbi:ATP-dependent Clp protease proteolytic subunit [Brucella melitensis]|uniref:ATP-dependent Clp protease proteolytic subunit n=1 Tax=Brucella melitensis TaxID=29459 RepID=UPI0032C08C8F
MTKKKEEKTNLFHTVRQSNEYTFFFDEELGSPDEYRDLSMILMQAGEDDEINLMINGPGGYVDTAAQLSNLIANCRGTVIGHLLGPSASAYCTIFLSCHGWVVHPHATLMGHTFSGGFCEKGQEIKKAYESYNQFVEDMMLDIYYPFFSIEEIEAMVKENKNIYLNSKEINKRIETLADHREEMLKNSQKPHPEEHGEV